MAKLLGKCPRCQGNLYDEHGTTKCLQCGYEISTPRDKRAWYQANKDAMVRDLVANGKEGVQRKWGIKSQLISHLKHTPLYHQLKGQPAVVTKPLANHLPPLPAFSNDWSPEVQIKWLEVWGQRR